MTAEARTDDVTRRRGGPVLSEMFDRAVARWPDAIALDVPPGAGRNLRQTLSYAELSARSASWARLLREVAAPGVTIAVLLPRTCADLFVAQLAVLGASCAHVCLDPGAPDGQLRDILDDARPALMVTDTAGASRAGTGPWRLVLTDGPSLGSTPPGRGPAPGPADPATWPAGPVAVGGRVSKIVMRGPSSQVSEAGDLAYVIYTSGTTGKPKGIAIAHRSIGNLIESDRAEFALGPGDRVAQGSSAAYDSSVEEIWMAWSSGASVVVMDDDTARRGPDLVPWLRDERITVVCPPPTLLRATGCEDPRRELPELRLVYVGGEALPPDVADRWARGRRLVNGYGPTECTVTCLRHDVRPGVPVAIGRPVPGMQAWVLDDRLIPVPPGERGELCMSGVGLARGYLGLPEQNAVKFPRHARLGRIYRTGDLVHQDPGGVFHYHGRIDAQVKLRGFRIELEAVEACLAACPRVREAACTVQGEGEQQALAAHVVPTDPHGPPDLDDLRRRVGLALPTYMVPALIAIAAELPRTVSGKLRRGELPLLEAAPSTRPRPAAPPAPGLQVIIAAALAQAVGQPPDISVDDDFFSDLGGTSLTAAMAVSALRRDPSTTSITVRDLYETRTVAGLADRVAATAGEARPAPEATAPPGEAARRGSGSAVGVTAAQTAWLVGELVVGAVLAYLTVFVIGPWVSARLGLAAFVAVSAAVLTLLLPLRTLVCVSAAVTVKKVLVGRYRPVRAPVWSALFVRMWIVRHVAGLIPWQAIAGTEVQCAVLRALGARIGRRVHIHRGVDLAAGGWDLLDIGDDVTIGQDAALRLVQLDAGRIVVGPVTLADGATLDVRAGVAPHARVGRDGWLGALSSLPTGGVVPDGERWDGVPARPAGPAPRPPRITGRGRTYRPAVHGALTIAADGVLQTALAMPAMLTALIVVIADRLDYPTVLDALGDPAAHLPALAAVALAACLSIVVTVGLQALASRALGRVTEGVIDRWSAAYIRVWLKTALVTSAGRWLSGGMFWPVWLRWAGMSLGPGCEISTIIDVVPELVDIGPDTFFADGIYLAGPRLQRGTVTLARLHVGPDTFLGNHAVVPGGQDLAPNVLLGVCTVADDTRMTPGSSWFGHPAFELPRREIVDSDRRETHEPSAVRVLSRSFWEWLRFALPCVPLGITVGWTAALSATARARPGWETVVIAAPAAATGAIAAACAFVLVLKWALLGRVRPGTHPLWSCWCSRWDFLYVAWGVIAAGVLARLDETLLLPVYLRAMGMRIGRRVVLGGGFAQVVDPDMIEIGDHATVSAMFQAHTFEDRVLKIAPVRIGAHSTLGDATVPLYGADVGEHTYVAAHSVIMKNEHLRPGVTYEGAPTRRLGEVPRPWRAAVVSGSSGMRGRHRG